MLSLRGMPSSPLSVLSSCYTTFAASAMLVGTVVNEVESIANQIMPGKLQSKILSRLRGFLGSHSTSEMVLVIQEFNGLSVNQIYPDLELYLRTNITPSVGRLDVSKEPEENKLSVAVSKEETVVDVFRGIELRWQLVSTLETDQQSGPRSIELIFHKKHKDEVLGTYIPYVVERSRAIKEESKVMKLYSIGDLEDYDCPWESTNLSHPSTFSTLAMDDTIKKELIADLDRLVKRRELYQKVGKAWKRGYLLYGPPGTGKSSLIAAMANYLKFNIYDLDLTSLWDDSQLRILLERMENRSMLVVEDIDCLVDATENGTDSQFTLSGLLNLVDGLWSGCGDEKILVFTTNHKERLDPAFLRPGRIDMLIHMSYCSPSEFKTLAANYLNVNNHPLLAEIDKLMIEVEVTPAEVAEELIKYEEVDVALDGIIKYLRRKKMRVEQFDEQVQVRAGTRGDKMGVKRNKMKRTRRAKGRR